MQWIWIFIAMPLAGLLCSVVAVVREGGMKTQGHAGLLAKTFLPGIREGRLPRRCKHKINWISPLEFQALARSSEDLILIDFGSEALGDPAEFGCPNFLLVEPGDLQDVLFWSPPCSCIVVYGPRQLCLSVIPMISEVPGTTPVHFLSQGPGSSSGELSKGHFN
jgi:hypothetical protein